MNTKGSTKIKNNPFLNALRRLGKRLFPPGSRGRWLYYRLQGYDFLSSLSTRQPSPAAEETKRFAAQLKRQNKQSVAVIVASTKLEENEGQRSTNLALELSRRGIPSVFAYWRWDRDEWEPQDRLDEGILQIPVDVLAKWPETVFRAFDCPQKLVLFEFPHPSLFAAVAEANAAGWITFYDGVDDWEAFHAVGQAHWYERDFERFMLSAADAVTAITERLADRLRGLSAKEVALVPNGLWPGVQVVDQPRSLERGEITLGYFGYLSEAWFDWNLIQEAAAAEPEWRFYLIGYGVDPETLSLPANVHLLGKKPRDALAAYAQNWDVAIIPFKPGPLAASSDPIKAYELLAMGLPVVTTGVNPMPGGEAFIFPAHDRSSFLSAVRHAAGMRDSEVNLRKEFAMTCTWGSRVDAIYRLISTGAQRIGEKQALFGLM